MKVGGRDAAVVVAWLVLAPLALFVALRLVGLEDRSARFFALVTFTPVLLAPAWVVLLGGVALRQWLLVAVAAVVVVAHIAWVAPDVRWWSAGQPEAAGGAFTLVAANLYLNNADVGKVTAALRRLDADVLVVEELTPPMADALGGLRYSAAVEDPRLSAFGSAIYSRFPLSDVQRFHLDDLPALRADVAVPGGPVTVVAVHTLQPLARLHVLRRQLRQLDELAATLRASGREVVLAGDFNATRQHRDFRRLLKHGLRDAHLERGRGRTRTWPADRGVPPFALIDHVLVSKGIAVQDAGTARIPGSDHLAVTATLARSSP